MLRINDNNDRIVIAKAVGYQALPIDPVIARVERDVLLGGFMFNSFTGKGGSIWGQAAGFNARWLNRDLLAFMFRYIFVQLECRSLFTRVAQDNQRSLDFNHKLGFSKVFFLDHVYPDGRGQWIFRMAPEECKWIEYKPIQSTVH